MLEFAIAGFLSVMFEIILIFFFEISIFKKNWKLVQAEKDFGK